MRGRVEPRRLQQQRHARRAAQAQDAVGRRAVGQARARARRPAAARPCRTPAARSTTPRPGRAARRDRCAAPRRSCCTLGSATYVPRPPARTSSPRCTSPSSAWRSVMRETPSAVASSRSGGSRAPGRARRARIEREQLLLDLLVRGPPGLAAAAAARGPRRRARATRRLERELEQALHLVEPAIPRARDRSGRCRTPAAARPASAAPPWPRNSTYGPHERVALLAVEGVQHQAREVRERVGVRVEARVDEVRDVAPAEAVALRQLDRVAVVLRRCARSRSPPGGPASAPCPRPAARTRPARSGPSSSGGRRSRSPDSSSPRTSAERVAGSLSRLQHAVEDHQLGERRRHLAQRERRVAESAVWRRLEYTKCMPWPSSCAIVIRSRSVSVWLSSTYGSESCATEAQKAPPRLPGRGSASTRRSSKNARATPPTSVENPVRASSTTARASS